MRFDAVSFHRYVVAINEYEHAPDGLGGFKHNRNKNKKEGNTDYTHTKKTSTSTDI